MGYASALSLCSVKVLRTDGKCLDETAVNKGWIKDVGAALLKLGQLAGLNEEKARKCMDDTKLLDGIIKERMEGNTKYGIDTTPSFKGGKRIKAFEFEKLDKAIQQELK